MPLLMALLAAGGVLLIVWALLGARTADPVGKAAHRDRAGEEDDVGADVQQREPRLVKVAAVRQRQVQKGVADGDQAQGARGEDQPRRGRPART